MYLMLFSSLLRNLGHSAAEPCYVTAKFLDLKIVAKGPHFQYLAA